MKEPVIGGTNEVVEAIKDAAEKIIGAIQGRLTNAERETLVKHTLNFGGGIESLGGKEILTPEQLERRLSRPRYMIGPEFYFYFADPELCDQLIKGSEQTVGEETVAMGWFLGRQDPVPLHESQRDLVAKALLSAGSQKAAEKQGNRLIMTDGSVWHRDGLRWARRDTTSRFRSVDLVERKWVIDTDQSDPEALTLFNSEVKSRYRVAVPIKADRRPSKKAPKLRVELEGRKQYYSRDGDLWMSEDGTKFLDSAQINSHVIRAVTERRALAILDRESGDQDATFHPSKLLLTKPAAGLRPLEWYWNGAHWKTLRGSTKLSPNKLDRQYIVNRKKSGSSALTLFDGQTRPAPLPVKPPLIWAKRFHEFQWWVRNGDNWLSCDGDFFADSRHFAEVDEKASDKQAYSIYLLDML